MSYSNKSIASSTKSVSQNIQNIFFVLKIIKRIFLPGGGGGGGGAGGGGGGAGGGAFLTAITVVTSSQRFA
jgi:hypothetical protein